MPHEAPQSQKPKFEFIGDKWHLPTDIDLVNGATDALAKRLEAAGWDKEAVDDMEIGFREVLVNAIAHGNLGLTKPETGGDLATMSRDEQALHPTSKKVYVVLDINKDQVVIEVYDEGEGFTEEEVPNPTAEENLFRSKGRGLLLARSYYDSITHSNLPTGHLVTMTRERK
jgi:serine/threonine-protein kinase RsbW